MEMSVPRRPRWRTQTGHTALDPAVHPGAGVLTPLLPDPPELFALLFFRNLLFLDGRSGKNNTSWVLASISAASLRFRCALAIRRFFAFFIHWNSPIHLINAAGWGFCLLKNSVSITGKLKNFVGVTGDVWVAAVHHGMNLVVAGEGATAQRRVSQHDFPEAAAGLRESLECIIFQKLADLVLYFKFIGRLVWWQISYVPGLDDAVEGDATPLHDLPVQPLVSLAHPSLGISTERVGRRHLPAIAVQRLSPASGLVHPVNGLRRFFAVCTRGCGVPADVPVSELPHRIRGINGEPMNRALPVQASTTALAAV